MGPFFVSRFCRLHAQPFVAYCSPVEPNNHGEIQKSVSPALNQPTVLSATETLRRYIIGEYKGKFPSVNWNTDGNIFAVLGTLGRAWKHTDRNVADRLRILSQFAMAGELPSSVPNARTLSEGLRKEMEGYDELLSFCIGLSVADYVEDDEEEFDEDSDE